MALCYRDSTIVSICLCLPVFIKIKEISLNYIFNYLEAIVERFSFQVP